jgi:GH25 family lysozyme M1 (1,4-beta-N-acetylmuramidase)
MCWKTASPFNPLFYVYDVEETCLTDAVINAWAEQMRKYGAKKLGVYIAHHFYTKYKANVPLFDFVWIPRYGKNTGVYDPKFAPAYPCDLHQFTEVGKVPGLADRTVDINRLTGTKPLEWFLTTP